MEQNLEESTIVRGVGLDGRTVYGKLEREAAAGDDIVYVQYSLEVHKSGGNDLDYHCYVGGNPDPTIKGCKYQ